MRKEFGQASRHQRIPVFDDHDPHEEHADRRGDIQEARKPAAAGVFGQAFSRGPVARNTCQQQAHILQIAVEEHGVGCGQQQHETLENGIFGVHNLTEKTGLVAGIAVVDSENDVMIITNDGVIIRTGVEEIRECGRGSQGVIVMRTGEDVKVISIARTDKEEEDPAEAEEETSESAENAESTEE